MGKYERGEAEIFEKNIDSLLNEKVVEDLDAIKMAEHIKKSSIKKIKKAVWKGRDYSGIGDEEITYEDDSIISYEVKKLEKGRGTAANPGQDSLTEYGLFKDAKSWSSFREDNHHDQFVISVFNKFLISKNKPIREFKTGISRSNFADSYKNTKDFIPFQEEIVDFDRKERLAYIEYLMKQKQDPESIKIFVMNFLFGNHTKETYNKKILESPFPENYKVFYLVAGKIVEEKIPSGINKMSFFIIHPKDTTNVIICGKDKDEKTINIFRIAINWKNKFQGIQTPSLNVFYEY